MNEFPLAFTLPLNAQLKPLLLLYSCCIFEDYLRITCAQPSWIVIVQVDWRLCGTKSTSRALRWSKDYSVFDCLLSWSMRHWRIWWVNIACSLSPLQLLSVGYLQRLTCSDKRAFLQHHSALGCWALKELIIWLELILVKFILAVQWLNLENCWFKFWANS